MTGRGRPRRAKSPETKRANKETTPTTRKPVTETTVAKKKQQQNQKLPEDYATEEVKKTPKATRTKKSAKGCKDRATSPEMTKQSANATTPLPQVQPSMDESKDYTAMGARPKICDVRARSPAEEREDITDSKTQKGRKGRKSSVKAPGEQVISQEELSLQVSVTEPFLKDNKTAAKKADANTVLRATLDKLKIKKTERSEAAEIINDLQKVILKHLKSTLCFKQVQEPLRTGSYYENLKISTPDEFDIMFPIPVDRVAIKPFGDDGAFYVASLCHRSYNPLKKFQSMHSSTSDILEESHLSASDILKEFRNEVIKIIKTLPGDFGVKIDRKKRGCPAVTLSIEKDPHPISVDIVLCLAVTSSWPSFTTDGFKVKEWLGRKVKRNYKFKPYYLVPKYEGKGTAEIKGVPAQDAWRISFSHVEKDILKNHGSEKTCCEKDGARCCRKDCLKLLKHLLSLLKDQHKAFDKFCSYHAKTTLLHACCSRAKDSQWAAADLTQCFQQLLTDFEDNLERGQLDNFFIPTQNLFSGCSKKSCTTLASFIRKERGEGFPIFN